MSYKKSKSGCNKVPFSGIFKFSDARYHEKCSQKLRDQQKCIKLASCMRRFLFYILDTKSRGWVLKRWQKWWKNLNEQNRRIWQCFDQKTFSCYCAKCRQLPDKQVRPVVRWSRAHLRNLSRPCCFYYWREFKLKLWPYPKLTLTTWAATYLVKFLHQ